MQVTGSPFVNAMTRSLFGIEILECLYSGTANLAPSANLHHAELRPSFPGTTEVLVPENARAASPAIQRRSAKRQRATLALLPTKRGGGHCL